MLTGTQHYVCFEVVQDLHRRTALCLCLYVLKPCFPCDQTITDQAVVMRLSEWQGHSTEARHYIGLVGAVTTSATRANVVLADSEQHRLACYRVPHDIPARRQPTALVCAGSSHLIRANM